MFAGPGHVVGRALALIVLIAASAAFAAQDPPLDVPATPPPAPLGGPSAPAPVHFEPRSLDFGVVEPGGKMNGEVRIRNTGTEALSIESTKASCHCTTMDDLAGKVIAPGAELIFKAWLEPLGLAGRRSSTITFVFTGFKPFEYHLRARMSRQIQAAPEYINVGPGAMSGRTEVSSLDGKAFRILGAGGAAPVHLDDFDPVAGEARSRYLIAWDLSGFDPETCLDASGARMPSWWVIETDRPGAAVVDVKVRSPKCMVMERARGRRWSPDPRVLLDETVRGERREIDVRFRWARGDPPDDEIARVEVESGPLSAEFLRAETSGRETWCTVAITVLPDAPPGLFIGRMRFFSDRTKFTAAVDVIGRVGAQATAPASAPVTAPMTAPASAPATGPATAPATGPATGPAVSPHGP